MGEPRRAFGCSDVHGLKRGSFAFHVKADGVHDCEYTVDYRGDRSIVIDVAVDRCDLGTRRGNNRETAVGVPRGDPNGKTGVVQVSNDPPAEKSGTPEHRHRLHGHSATCAAGLIAPINMG
jgi:hypothetical protein